MNNYLRLITTILLLNSTLLCFAQKSPYKTITVALDGSGEYKSIQEAINSLRDLGPDWAEIKIKNGTYHEKLVIPSWKHLIILKGESKENTIIQNDDFSGKIDLKGQKLSTFTSYTMLVEGENIQIENLTIQNTSCNQGQAVALHVEGDYFVAKNVNLKGCQDTLYAATNRSRQYYENCYIEGTVDFIFGQATAVFKNCTIKSLSNSYITAAATDKNNPFGFVFFNCNLISAENIDEVYLGRPWRPHAKTVFINTKMGNHILPLGWDKWDGDNMFPDKYKTTFYAEYQSEVADSSLNNRAKWSHQLSLNEVKKYTLKQIFNGWIPK